MFNIQLETHLCTAIEQWHPLLKHQVHSVTDSTWLLFPVRCGIFGHLWCCLPQISPKVDSLAAIPEFFVPGFWFHLLPHVADLARWQPALGKLPDVLAAPLGG